MEIKKIFNANVYIDGTNSLLGRAREIVLPSVTMNTEEHKGLGMLGALELPVGLVPLDTQLSGLANFRGALAERVIQPRGIA